MENIIATILISLGTGIAGSFSGWFFGRKRQKIANIDAATETWQKIVNSLECQIDKLLKQREQDAIKIEEMSMQMCAMKAEIASLKQDIETLQSKIKNIQKLENKIVKYEKLLNDNNINY